MADNLQPQPNGSTPPKDYSHLPPAVARLAQEADALQAGSVQEVTQGPPSDPLAAPQAPSSPPDPQHPLAPHEEEEPPAPPQGTKDYSWWHKYQSEKGRHKATVEKTNQTLQELTQELHQLRRSQQVPSPQQQDYPKPDRGRIFEEAGIGAEQRELWGDDMLDTMGRVATAAAHQTAEPLVREIQNLNQKVGYHQALTIEEQLTKSVPEWVNLNRDANFLAWLALPDPYSGAIRKELLDAAYFAGQTDRVAAFLTASCRPTGRLEPRTSPPVLRCHEDLLPVMQAPPSAPSNRIPLEQFAAPGAPRPAGAAPNGPAICR